MEKLDYLVWEPVDADALLLPCVRGLTVSVAAELPRMTLLMGRGPELAALVEVWLDSLDERGPVEAALGRADGYLVTESVPQHEPVAAPVGTRSPGVTHLTWFPKPERLTDEEFYRGWHEVHTPSSFALHPRRDGYVRDAVARPVTAGAPPVRAIVSEHFPEVEDYTDPRRLFGDAAALQATVDELPLYGDQADMSSRPLWRTVLRPAR